MKLYIEKIAEKVKNGFKVSKKEALKLYYLDFKKLTEAADELRAYFLKDKFDLCTIINSKSGKCPENCRFCAQSAHYKTACEEYPLLDEKTILEDAKKRYAEGIPRYSLVSSGRRLSDQEVDKLCRIVKNIKKEIPDLYICISAGLLNYENFKKLKDAGVKRVHNNLETSENYFPKVCTSHQFSEKLLAIENARKAGMEICSGGIIGLGESVEDRIDMAIKLRDLEIKSIPINVLNPIKNTPFENNKSLTDEEINRTIAVFRFINPKSYIRLAGGRSLIKDFGRDCFKSGSNAAITGDMLTTFGITPKDDIKMIEELSYNIRRDI